MTLSRILPISLLVSALVSPLAAETRGVRDLQDAFVAVAKDVGPSVVSISVKGKERGSHFRFGLFMGDPDDSGIGSGVIIASDGHILTNEHVIAKADRILVALSNGKKYRARVVGKDPRSDLAVIKINATGLKAVEAADSGHLKIGQWAIALGNPFGIARDAKPTVTVGVISGLHRDIPRRKSEEKYYGDLIQTDAAINPGNSGGPLVDIDGKLIGINVLIYSTTGGYQGIGFAIPANYALKVAKSLLKTGKVEYGWLGVKIGDIAEEDIQGGGLRGTRVTRVFEHTPAAVGGLVESDVIFEFDGHKVHTSDDLIKTVNQIPAGKTVVVRLYRNSKERELKVTLGRRGEPMFAWRGLVIHETDSFVVNGLGIENETGVVVTKVLPDSLADQAGVKVRLVITEVSTKDGKQKHRTLKVESFKNAVANQEGPLFLHFGEKKLLIQPTE